jgi:hypothetical protein
MDVEVVPLARIGPRSDASVVGGLVSNIDTSSTLLLFLVRSSMCRPHR